MVKNVGFQGFSNAQNYEAAKKNNAQRQDYSTLGDFVLANKSQIKAELGIKGDVPLWGANGLVNRYQKYDVQKETPKAPPEKPIDPEAKTKAAKPPAEKTPAEAPSTEKAPDAPKGPGVHSKILELQREIEELKKPRTPQEKSQAAADERRKMSTYIARGSAETVNNGFRDFFGFIANKCQRAQQFFQEGADQARPE